MDTRQMIQLFGSFFSSQVQPVFQHYMRERQQGVTEKRRDGMGPELTGQVDIDIDKLYAEFLGQHFPNDTIVSEEHMGIWDKKQDMWVVDPCDGTHNFLNGSDNIGSTCTRIQNGIVTFAAIFLPMRELQNGCGLYLAIKGHGAAVLIPNSPKGFAQLHVSENAELSRSMLLLEGPNKILDASDVVRHLKAKCWRSRTYSATSLSGVLVASGISNPAISDALVTVENKIWDNLPAALIIEEAGGKVTNYDGTPFNIDHCGNLIMSNGHVHQQILDAIRENHVL